MQKIITTTTKNIYIIIYINFNFILDSRGVGLGLLICKKIVNLIGPE